MKKISLLILVMLFIFAGCSEQNTYYSSSETISDLDIEQENSINDVIPDENENFETQLDNDVQLRQYRTMDIEEKI